MPGDIVVVKKGRGEGSNAREIYDANLDLIETVIRQVSRRMSLRAEETEELRSDVHFRLLKDDCAVLGRLRDRSRLRQFLIVVASNEVHNARIKKWGKWRPPTAVKRMGPLAVLLYQLIDRDKCSPSEAIQILAPERGVTVSELEALAEQLPPTSPGRTPVDRDPDALQIPGGVASVESKAIRREIDSHTEPRKLLSRMLAAIDSEERVILKLYYLDGLSWIQIGHGRGFDDKKIFRAKDRIHRELRKALERENIHWPQAEQMLRHRLQELHLDEAFGMGVESPDDVHRST